MKTKRLSKFKVGEKVKAIHHWCYRETIKAGDVGTIKEVLTNTVINALTGDNEIYIVAFTKNNKPFYQIASDDMLEKIKVDTDKEKTLEDIRLALIELAKRLDEATKEQK